MKFVMFYHSLLSDWNHGNAHFLRGVAADLVSRGHDVRVYEPHDAWSVQNLVAEHGEEPLDEVRRLYPGIKVVRYLLEELDLDEALGTADAVIVHEWNDPALVHRVGDHRRDSGGQYRLFFHDTHHRTLTDRNAIAACDLRPYDGVLAFGEVIRQRYLAEGWAVRAWTWHEAADTRIFRPVNGQHHIGDLVWVGNWGEEDRTAELQEFLLDPVRELKLKARVYGVRYPTHGRAALARAGMHYSGWLPNYRVPLIFARFRLTVHVPRRPYAQELHGIPTIRPFEAMACGIPLVCAPWEDREGLFTPGEDYLVAQNGKEMKRHLRDLLKDRDRAMALAAHARHTILERHTCAHRVDQLLEILQDLGVKPAPQPAALPHKIQNVEGRRPWPMI